MRAAGDVKGNGKNEIVIEWTGDKKEDGSNQTIKKRADVCSFLFNLCIPDDVNVAHFLLLINTKD